MDIIVPTLNQIAFLFGFITIGFIITKLRLVSANSAETLSKLENLIFIPALVMGTFIENFTVDKIQMAWKLIVVSFLIAFIAIPLAIAFLVKAIRNKARVAVIISLMTITLYLYVYNGSLLLSYLLM